VLGKGCAWRGGRLRMEMGLGGRWIGGWGGYGIATNAPMHQTEPEEEPPPPPYPSARMRAHDVMCAQGLMLRMQSFFLLNINTGLIVVLGAPAKYKCEAPGGGRGLSEAHRGGGGSNSLVPALAPNSILAGASPHTPLSPVGYVIP